MLSSTKTFMNLDNSGYEIRHANHHEDEAIGENENQETTSDQRN